MVRSTGLRGLARVLVGGGAPPLGDDVDVDTQPEAVHLLAILRPEKGLSL